MAGIRIQWQARSQLSEDSIHSLLIALLRGMAALQVAAAHLRAEVFPSLRTVAHPPLYYEALAFITGFAHQAVVVFFLISGWLVGGSLLNKLGQPQAVRGYAIDRATRLWTVLVPTMLIMVVFGIVTGAVDPSHPDLYSARDYSARSFLGNLVGLQTVLVKNFGGNYALWSLANETWYYVAFPILLLAFRNRGWLSQSCSVIALGLIAALLPWAITLYFALWLLGAAFARIRIECGAGVRIALVALCAGLSVYYRITGSNDDLVPASFLQDFNCSLPFLLLLSTLQIKIDPAAVSLRRLNRFATFFSEFSFTLYVLHVPTIGLLRYLGRTALGRDQLAPNAPLDYLVYLAMLGMIVGFSYLSYLMFESRTRRVRGKLKSILLRPEPRKTQEAMLSSD
ncbi:MAG: acyltransferase family protein [Telluria sp.]